MVKASPRLIGGRKRSYAEDAHEEDSEFEPSDGSSSDSEGDSAGDYSEEEEEEKPKRRPSSASTPPSRVAASSASSSSNKSKAGAAKRKGKDLPGIGEDASLQAAIAASLKSVACGGGCCAAASSSGAVVRPPHFREAPANHTGNYMVEYAKTGRAKCGVCGELIAHRLLRIGLEVADKGFGIITRWQHVECSRLPTDFCEKALADHSKLGGMSDLKSDEDTARVVAMLSAVDVPAGLAIDPDAEVEAAASAWTQSREPPDTLLAPMLPYQKEGLAWMCAQEDGPLRGGILADEMGMGKTLQAISVMLAHPSSEWKKAPLPSAKARGKAAAPAADALPEDIAEAALREGLVRGGTLVIVPVIALIQWGAEILKWAAPGTLSIYTYHGPKREPLSDVLAKYDVVLTTYSTLEYDFRQAQADEQVHCGYCGKKFKSDQKLAFHNRWFCGPNARRSEAQSKTQKRRKPGNLAKMMLGAVDDESEFEESDEDSDYEDDDEFGPVKGKKKGKAASKSKKAHGKAEKQLQGKKKALVVDLTVKSKGAIDKGKKSKSKGKADDEGKESASGKGKDKGGKKAGKGGGGARKGKGKGGGGGGGGDDSDDEDEDGGNGGDSDGLGVRARRAKEKAEKAARVAASSTLHRVHWHRVILDEAHAIKDRRCSTAQAVFGLHAHVRWCLSGTPLQNRVGELYSLIQFLRLDPYSFYFCKSAGCDCKCREYKFDAEWRACDYCGHSPLQHYSLFNRDIVNLIKKYGFIGAGRTGFVKLKRNVLDKCLLRRTKAGRANEMVLPPKLVTLEANFLDDREFDFYQAIYTQSQAQFGSYVQAGTLLNNYAHIFDLLTRLRQAVDHPYLVLHSNRGAEAAAEAALSSGLDTLEADAVPLNDSTVICGLCFEDASLPVEAGCGHFYCRACVVEYIDAHVEGAALQCPTCSLPLSVELHGAAPSPTGPSSSEPAARRRASAAGAEVSVDGNVAPAVRHKGILGRLDLARFQSSTKVEALMEELHLMQENDPAAKAIVFSQFVSFLDLMEFRMQKAGIKVVKLNGGMTVAARDAVLTSFKVGKTRARPSAVVTLSTRPAAARRSSNLPSSSPFPSRPLPPHIHPSFPTSSPSVATPCSTAPPPQEDFNTRVILISLKAGGVALNLTVASHIYLMDPWWNPAAEYQAIDRAHRLGQNKPIRAVRFVVRNTVEERILRLQDKKRLVFEGTVGGDIGSLSQLSEEDLRFLFQN
jgi:DNA repair protein RAD16